jgi:hypothetical protein
MKLLRGSAAALLTAIAFAASGADEPPPLSLDKALAEAARRGPERLLAETRGLPYLLVAPPRHEFLAPQDAARMEAMARFFDVILVDLEESALSERMSTAYGDWDRKRARTPDATVTLRALAAYQDLLSRRNAARMNQRLARSALAIALGRPDRLPAELIEPAIRAGDDTPDAQGPPRASPSRGTGPEGARRAHALAAATLELDWLVRSERPRTQARNAVGERVLDEARASHDAGEPADFGNAMAATVEAQRDERGVEYAILLARERLASLRAGPAGVRRSP